MDEPAAVDAAVWSPESSPSEGRRLEIKDEEGEEDRWRREENQIVDDDDEGNEGRLG